MQHAATSLRRTQQHGTAGLVSCLACAGTAWLVSRRHGAGLLGTGILTMVLMLHVTAGCLSMWGQARASGHAALAALALKLAFWSGILLLHCHGDSPPGWRERSSSVSAYAAAGCSAFLDIHQACGAVRPMVLTALHILQSLLLGGMVELAKHQAQLPSRGWAWSCAWMMACTVGMPRLADALLRRVMPDHAWAPLHASRPTAHMQAPVQPAAAPALALSQPQRLPSPRAAAAAAPSRGAADSMALATASSMYMPMQPMGSRAAELLWLSSPEVDTSAALAPCSCSCNEPVCICGAQASPGSAARETVRPAAADLSQLQTSAHAVGRTPAVSSSARTAVERMRAQPYTSRLGTRSKVCIKLDSHVSVSQLPQDLVPQLKAALAGIGYPRHHMLDVAARQGCIAISMELIDEVLEGPAAGAMIHASQELPARMALAVGPVLAPLMVPGHSSNVSPTAGLPSSTCLDGADQTTPRGMTVVCDGAAARLLWDDSGSCWADTPAPVPAVACDAAAGPVVAPAASTDSATSSAAAAAAAPLGMSQHVAASSNRRAEDLVMCAVQLLQPQVQSSHTDAEPDEQPMVLRARVLLLDARPCTGVGLKGAAPAPVAVAGWQPCSPGQHAELPAHGPQLRLLARCQGSYLPTHVQPRGGAAAAAAPVALHAVHKGSGCAVLAEVEVEVQVAWELLPRHHAGGTPLGVLPMVLELWRGELHCVSCAPLLLQLPAMQSMQAQPWWWGASSRAVRQALQQLQDVAAAQEAAVQQGMAGAAAGLPSWNAFMADLVTWFVHMRTVPERSQPMWPPVRMPGLPMRHPALAPAQLQALGAGLSTYADQVQLRHVLCMLRQQQGSARAWAAAAATAAPSCGAPQRSTCEQDLQAHGVRGNEQVPLSQAAAPAGGLPATACCAPRMAAKMACSVLQWPMGCDLLRVDDIRGRRLRSHNLDLWSMMGSHTRGLSSVLLASGPQVQAPLLLRAMRRAALEMVPYPMLVAR